MPVLIYISSSPSAFFGYQLAVAALELAVAFTKAYKILPSVVITKTKWDWRPLRQSLKFSLGIAFAALTWIVVTQTDKLMLSGLISLTDYAYFILAVLLAGGVMMISRPVSGAILPRLTRLNAHGNQSALIDLYRTATQFVSVISIPAVLVLALYSEQVLFAWTGSKEIAIKAAPILTLYAIGNGIMVLSAFPYYLQYAKGDLRLHVIGNALFLTVFLPTIYFLVMNYGVLGAGYAWIVSNLVMFFVYVPFVHKAFSRNLHLKWLIFDVAIIGFLPLLFFLMMQGHIDWSAKRLMVAVNLLIVLVIGLALALLSATKLRDYCWSYLLQKLRSSFNRREQ